MADDAQDPSARVRTPLLALISAEALEQDYQMVAQRRVARGGQPDNRSRLSGRVGVIAVVAVFGVLLTIAAVQTSANADIELGKPGIPDRSDRGPPECGAGPATPDLGLPREQRP